MRKLVLFCIICIVLLSSIHSIAVPQQQTLLINLFYQNTNGMINHFGEMNCGPLPNLQVTDGVDLTSQYQQIGIDFIRTHDFNGPTDISTIFPDFDQDPTDPASYNFTTSDYHITSIINADCNVFYRFGESASSNKSLRMPPSDFDKWATICKYIVMHYNDGWAEGYHYNISYFEVWNEPDLSGFWNGTVEQYYELYKTTAETLKAYNPNLKIGGPCTSSVYNENFTIRFLQFVKEHHLPLDFYSWHMYAKKPNDLFLGASYIRQLLDDYGFEQTENINTEWNIDIIKPQRDKDNGLNAAFTACTLTSFLDSGLDYGFRYRGTQDHNRLNRFIGFDLALFSYDGLFKTPALSYLALQYLATDSPLRIKTPVMDAQNGITYVAGISEDKKTMSIILSNFEADDQEYTITMDDVPWNDSYQLVQYVIDDNTHLQIMENISFNDASFIYTSTLQKSTVHFLRITDTEQFPNEGPDVLKIPFLLKLRFLDPIRAIIGIILITIAFG